MEYTGSIQKLRHWSQELLGYEFAIIHRASSMIKDVDDLSRHIDVLVHRYLTQARCMHLVDIAKRPFAYSFNSFFLVPIPVVSLHLIVILPLKHLRPFPRFQLFIIIHFTLLRHLFFNHFTSQNLLLIPFITLSPLKILVGSLLTPLLPLLVHSFLFSLEERLQTSD